MEVVIGISLVVGLLVGMIKINSNNISKLDERVDKVPETYLAKKDFDKFDDRLFEELKSIRQDIKDASK